MTTARPSTPVIENRKLALHSQVLDSFEAGIVLEGWEVKSIRQSQINIEGSWVTIQKGVPLLVGSMIGAQNSPNNSGRCQRRRRVLLLHKSEISSLQSWIKRAGIAVRPLSLYWKGRHLKCKILVAVRDVRRKANPTSQS
ncbi:trans-translation protein [Candidatus Tremblaya phenacola PAVE]|nr:trans-translation protein [Candidatus Tremblaya phenacola PAVE]